MDEIELVMKIPKEEYEMIVNSEDCGLHTLTRAVAHGTILPKGHGRLIDADEFKNYCQAGLENVKPLFKTEKYCKLAIDITQGIIADVDEMETIIEADKEVE